MQLSLGLGAPTMRVVVLGSGSSGNALVVESGVRRLLIDAGFSCRELERRLELVGIDGAGFDGVLLTHEHGDHIRGAARFGRRHRVPLFATEGTFAGVRLGRHPPERRVVRSGKALEVGAFRIEP
ncbi:MAG: MBL fold metallo-hydrolase, partial [Thermoanaerobaculia bacterium]|nr:MBL fold metallo-hydrolase [Thermoanaerobaculia bacterium]